MSLATLLYEHSKNHGSINFLLASGLTYHETARRAYAVSKLVGNGETVVHFMQNSDASVVAYLGAMWAGSKVVAVDPLTSAEDLKFILDDSSPSLVITDRELYEREKSVLKDYRTVTELPPPSQSMEEPEEYQKNQVGLVYYYAGIAGRTMAVNHSATGLVRNAESLSEAYGLESITSLMTVPVAHVLGNSLLSTTLVKGGQVYVMNKFDVEGAAEAVRKYGVNLLSTVPLVYDMIVQRDREEFKSLSLCVSSAAPLSKATAESFRNRFGRPIVQQYGFTEGLVLTFQPPQYWEKATVGLPLKGVETKIMREDGKEAEVGEVGELYVRAPWLMVGYSSPRETEMVFKDGWLRTGDLMTRDQEGFLYFKGVKKRMLKYKGYPIFPRDLEELIMTHPLVEEARVYGEAAGNLGQVPVAEVKLKVPKREGIEKEILDYVNSRIAFYKRVKQIKIL